MMWSDCPCVEEAALMAELETSFMIHTKLGALYPL
jgi:hypothetical protein